MLRFAILPIALVVALLNHGCSRSDGAPASLKNVAGTWLEDRAADAPGRVAAAAPKDPNLVKLVISNDGKFKMEYVTADGKPVAPNKSIEGTWRWDRGVQFTVTSNTMDEKQKANVPVAASGATAIGDTGAWRLSIALEESGQVMTRRVAE